jgi:lysophospholipase L1-like esterase
LTAGGWWQQAQDLLIAAGYPINLFQAGVGGTTSLQYSAIGKLNITQHKPAVALYSLISPNDGPSGAFAGGLTQKIMDAEFQTAMDFANFCRANGVLPVFTVLAPNDNYSSTDDAFRKGLIARAKAASIAVIDLTGAIATTANPQRFADGLGSDTVHPNLAGNTAMAQSFVSQYLALLQQSVSLRG